MESNMVSDDTKVVIRKAKEIYEQRLRAKLEQSDHGRFVAIEPESGDHFVADTFDEAVKMARSSHPTRLSHTVRVGHDAAFHLGVMTL
jgi:hypothetical protein